MGVPGRVAAVAVLSLPNLPAFAQVTTADIVGRVTDASGASATRFRGRCSSR